MFSTQHHKGPPPRRDCAIRRGTNVVTIKSLRCFNLNVGDASKPRLNSFKTDRVDNVKRGGIVIISKASSVIANVNFTRKLSSICAAASPQRCLIWSCEHLSSKVRAGDFWVLQEFTNYLDLLLTFSLPGTIIGDIRINRIDSSEASSLLESFNTVFCWADSPAWRSSWCCHNRIRKCTASVMDVGLSNH